MFRFALLIFSLFVFAFSAKAGKESYVQKGDKQMKNFCYKEAAEYYKTAAFRDTNDVVAWRKLANAYLLLNDYKSAEPIYQVLSAHYLAKPVDKFMYGQVLRAVGKYEEAQQAYTEFYAAAPNDPRAIEFKNFADGVKIFTEREGNYSIAPFYQNTAASEIGAAFYGDKIIFSSNEDKGVFIKHSNLSNEQPFYALYEFNSADTSSDNFATVKKLKGKINRKFNEGPLTFSANGKEMIFTRTQHIRKGTDRINKLGLFHAEFNAKKNRWGNIQPLSFNSFTYNTAHPSLSSDGRKLFFVSDMPGGFGETDIYVSERTDTGWGKPMNLGKNINTAGRELYPFIENNTKLYFSSDSRLGFGGLDVYAAHFSNGQWMYVTNLGVPVNTIYDDFGYASDGSYKRAFIISNRPTGEGSDDIYWVLQKYQPGFSFPMIHFDSSSYTLNTRNRKILDSIAGVIKQYPGMILEISGYSDSRGSVEFNVYLSKLRADACKNYFIEKGIDTKQLLTVGYGQQKPLNHCVEDVPCSEAERAVNRRVEFRVVKTY